MKWFPLHKTKVLGGARDISLGQKYLTTADPFDPNYNTPDLHRDLKKLTCPNLQLCLLWWSKKVLTLSGNKKGTQLSWGVKTKPVELSKKLKQIWVALSILIWAVTLQKIGRTKVSGPKMRSKVKILIWNWWKLAKSTILLPGSN